MHTLLSARWRNAYLKCFYCLFLHTHMEIFFCLFFCFFKRAGVDVNFFLTDRKTLQKYLGMGRQGL